MARFYLSISGEFPLRFRIQPPINSHNVRTDRPSRNNMQLKETFDNLRQQLPLIRKAVKWGSRLFVVVALMDIGYLVGVWPDWTLYAEGPIQPSSFIRTYIFQQYRHRDWPDLRWQPVSIGTLPRHVLRAFVVAEDARFYQHNGFDTAALKAAMEYNLSEKRIVYGASTISQQTVKNLFLSPSRNPLRKIHEIALTYGMESNMSKKRILELYLNVAEFGRGIYGVEAAAQYYWGIPASRLSPTQAVELAATLPAPIDHNPKTRSRFFVKREKKLLKNLGL